MKKAEDIIQNIRDLAQEHLKNYPLKSERILTIGVIIDNYFRQLNMYYDEKIIIHYSCDLYEKIQSYNNFGEDSRSKFMYVIQFRHINRENHEFYLYIS